MIKKFTNTSIFRYFIVSCLVSIFDFIIAYILFKVLMIHYLMACNLGIVGGFLLQYYLCVSYVFEKSSFLNSFTIFLATFIFGFILADITMWISYNLMEFSFIVSKGLSMVIPFFLTYLFRKGLMGIKIHKGIL